MGLSWLASLFEGVPPHMSFDEIRRLREQAETLERQREDDVIPLCEYVTNGVRPDERVLN